ncbi:N-acetylgalactosamine-6-O-sulfatase [Dyadobacter sp. CECT 9275]|uniref:N-acetylgalactosamine-6-O-sulfatase n=1 Tax=Dyadobacter helix TaxID=2822344 RepID=A0A916J7V0_9BACT|nr:arylsulfatase [Dyadobacter sp. CECT 9275]CAG4990960.1 N-acetylgalactosamine-6-O-sulfatase [Dyadobacter sp. CECT 9275]
MKIFKFFFLSFTFILAFPGVVLFAQKKAQKPNVIFIYADDVGYGDLSCYGATRISTPNLDRLAKEGARFTNAHASSATCTPSRYALMTGEYPWRRKGTGVLPGDASLIIPTDRLTLPSLFQNAGYKTGAVGKWHLGLGKTNKQINWNKPVSTGPNEVGFDYAFYFPATSDRVPTVFMENHEVVGLDPDDPIEVDYAKKIGNEPTGAEHPELLKLPASPNHGHNNTIVNGIGRIGFMKGGKQARWTDEEIGLVFLNKAESFIEENKANPFFLYFSLNDIHVPRMPSTQFKGKSGMGLRGDVILQMDWTVGEILKKLDDLKLTEHTLIIFSSDNGPVLDDGYADKAVELAKGHKPAGSLRGGKYSAFEGGTRVPFLARWPRVIKAGTETDALVCQIDMLSSFAALLQQKLSFEDAPDSFNQIDAFLAKPVKGRESLVLQGGTLALKKGNWKYIEPSDGIAYMPLTGTETGNDKKPQLYDLGKDLGEKSNVAAQNRNKVKLMQEELDKIREAGRSRY